MRASPTITRDRVTIHDPASAGDPKNFHTSLQNRRMNSSPNRRHRRDLPLLCSFLRRFCLLQTLPALTVTTTKCSAVLCSTAKCSVVLYSAAKKCSAVLCSTPNCLPPPVPPSSLLPPLLSFCLMILWQLSPVLPNPQCPYSSLLPSCRSGSSASCFDGRGR